MLEAEEIQIELDDVYACPGNCYGCILTTDERRGAKADMSTKTRRLILDALSEYIPKLSGLKRMNLTYGIADHLLMPDKYLLEIYNDASLLFEKVNLSGSGSIFMTTSVIGKTKTIEERLLVLAKASSNNKTNINPIIVLDPYKLAHTKFGKIYDRHIKYAKDLFADVDLSINLSSQVIAKMSPKDLVNFAVKHKFREVTINWIPTVNNLENTYSVDLMLHLEQWLLEFAKESLSNNVECSYIPVIKKSYDSWRCAMDGEMGDGEGLIQLSEKLLPETLSKSLQFDHFGNFFPKWEAIGDIPNNDRVNMKIWGNIHNNHNIEDMIKKGITETIKSTIKTLSNTTCNNCNYIGLCATTGFHAYTHVLKESDKVEFNNNCPHIAKGLFSKITKI